MFFKNLFLVSGILSVCLTAQAVENKNLTDTIQEVVVTGTPVKLGLNNVPVSVSVITREEIAASGQSSVLPILNGRIPGLFVTERGIIGFGVSAGAAGQISIRGVGGSPTTGVLVMMDGNPQYMGLFGHPLADIYSSSGVERVEVIRGPASMMYGSNAMGGVINILTRRTAKEGFSGEASIQGGSFNTKEMMLTGSFRHKNWNLLASLNSNSTDGHRDNSDFSQNSGYFKVGYRLNDHFRMHLDLNLSRFKATDPGPDTVRNGGYQHNALDIQRGSWSYSLEHEFAAFSGSMRLFRSFGTHDISDGFHSQDFNNGLIISESVRPFKNTLINFGLDGNVYGGVATQTRAHLQFVDSTVSEFGVYGFVQQTLLDRLTVNAGLRLQYNSQYGKEWIPAAGLAWDLNHGMTWKASLGKGFRSPTLRELFMFNHNPSLAPERVWSYETSFLKEFKTLKAHLEATLFYLNGENLILTGAMGRLYNGGSINNKGLELTAGFEPLEHLDVQLTFSHIEMESAVYATPRNHLYLHGMYQLGKFKLNSGLRFVEHLNTAIGGESFQTYALLNAGIQYSLLPNLEIRLSGNNLLNQSYETMRFYSMPGINGSLGASYRF
ncbi:MAG TPA: TonB-dependent receptor [Bacteroidales bacterium]|nr:TonB-dependent receptor [Bacteroidales bacterium]